MKTLEFETSKGKFKLIDMPDEIRVNGWNGAIIIDKENQISREKYGKGFYLRNVTEEQASEIVDLFNILPYHYQDYERDACAYNTAIESLHSLLKSKGVHLLYNPFIYKL